MRLTVIGCWGAYPPAGGATAGYLVQHADTSILLDCGSGVLAAIQHQLPLWQLDAVIISHYHTDHDADLGCLQYAAMIDQQLGRRAKPLLSWGPGKVQKLGYGAYCTGQSYLGLARFTVGDLQIETLHNPHEIESRALRVTAPGGQTLVYSGDTAWHAPLAAFAHGADCFLCEASFYAGGPPFTAQHLTAAQAGDLAKRAGAKLLVLTHLPHFGQHWQLAAQAAAVYGGKVLLAQQGLTLSLGGTGGQTVENTAGVLSAPGVLNK